MLVSKLWTALKDVEDPEFCVSIVDMGLVVDILESNGAVDVKVTFTAMGCPATEMIMDDIRDRLLAEADVRSVRIEVVWEPIWTPARLSTEGKLALQTMGVAV